MSQYHQSAFVNLFGVCERLGGQQFHMLPAGDQKNCGKIIKKLLHNEDTSTAIKFILKQLL